MAKRSLFNDISQGLAELKAEREGADNHIAKLEAELEQTRGLCVSSTAEAKEYVELKMHNAKLETENRRLKEELQHRDNVNTGMVSTLYGKPFEYWFGLQAVVDAAKKAVKQYGVVYPIPSSGHWAMTELEQAIKEVEGK